jgi:elongation factor 3
MAKKKGGNANAAKPAAAANALSEADIAAITAKIATLSVTEQAAAAAMDKLKSESSDDRAEAAKALAMSVKDDKKGSIAVFNVAGFSKPEESFVMVEKLQDMLTSNDANSRAGALQGIAAIASENGHAVEPYLLPLLQDVLHTAADKQKFVKEECAATAEALVNIMSPAGTKFAIDKLLETAARGGPAGKWEVQELALNKIATLSTKVPEQVGQVLADVITGTSDLMNASKKQVADAAKNAMAAACETAGNKDIQPFVPNIIEAVTNLSITQDTIHGLAATVFVQEVKGPALALVVPLLFRGLKEKEQAMKRKVATIVNNMCQLVNDPSYVMPFIDRLVPGLERAEEEMTDENAKRVLRQTRELLLQNVKLAESFVPMEPAQIEETMMKIIKHDMSMYDSPQLTAMVKYCAQEVWILIDKKDFEDETWNNALYTHVNSVTQGPVSAEYATKVIAELKSACFAATHVKDEIEDEEEEGEDLCNCEFTLGYGSKILLSNTRLHLKRGMRYGLVGPNDCGKSTLLRSIANGQLDGFPPADELRTVYVEHDVQGIEDGTTIIEFVMMDPKVTAVGVTKEEAEVVLAELGFNSKKAQGGQQVTNAVTTLSGGWKMKLALARAILSKADILLCDEPTNHLDVDNVAWVTEYLKTAKKADGNDLSTICVSHDSKFMDYVCSHIIHFESRKLKTYKGNLKAFVNKVPDAASYYTFKSSRTKFVFPEPSNLEGVKSKAKHILKMSNVGFTYPNTTRPILNDVSVAVTLGSRIAVIGPNGAGKSTAIKVLTGEMPPSYGTVWKHPNMRFAYVAQHAFHHLESHLEKTPVEYILWRYSGGYDKELAAQDTLKYTDEEKALMAKKISVIDNLGVEKKWVLERIVSRKKSKKSYDYECKWEGQPMESNTWMSLEKLSELGFKKMLSEVDIRENSKMGLTARPLTTKYVTEQLQELGLDEEYAAHVRINNLSGGQKVKVVLASAMWGQPHVLILDEPTNYLDRDSLAALAMAIKDFGGGVVIISHNRDFVEEVCRTLWFMVEGRLRVEGEEEKDEKIEEKLGPDTYTDAAGNTHDVKKDKELTKQEIKKMTKLIKAKIKKGEELTEDEENFCIDYDL